MRWAARWARPSGELLPKMGDEPRELVEIKDVREALNDHPPTHVPQGAVVEEGAKPEGGNPRVQHPELNRHKKVCGQNRQGVPLAEGVRDGDRLTVAASDLEVPAQVQCMMALPLAHRGVQANVLEKAKDEHGLQDVEALPVIKQAGSEGLPKERVELAVRLEGPGVRSDGAARTATKAAGVPPLLLPGLPLVAPFRANSNSVRLRRNKETTMFLDRLAGAFTEERLFHMIEGIGPSTEPRGVLLEIAEGGPSVQRKEVELRRVPAI